MRRPGKALSPKFTATADQYLVFLIAGGRGEGVGLRLLANGAEVAVWNGLNTEKFELIVHPLAYVAGKSLQLELFGQRAWRPGPHHAGPRHASSL